MGIPTPNHRPTRPFAGAGAGLLLSQFPRHLISNETLERKGNPKTIVFWRKPPKRRLWRMKRGGFEEVSRFSRHNVAGNRLTRRCVLLPAFPAGGKSGPSEAVPYIKSSKEKIVLAFCRRGIYNSIKSIKGQSVRRLVRRRRNRVRSPASWSL